MVSIGQTTLRKIRITLRLLEAEVLIGIFQRRISIRARGENTLSLSRIHNCSRFSFINYFFQKALIQSAGPYIM